MHIYKQYLTNTNYIKIMKQHAVAIYSEQQGLEVLRVQSDSMYDGLKLAMIRLARTDELNELEIEMQNSETYPTDLVGLEYFYPQIFKIIEI